MAGLLVGGTAAAAGLEQWTPSGEPDFTFSASVKSSGGSPTGEKPESKLFYTEDHRWWAVLGNTSDGMSLYGLDNHVWHEELELPGADPWMRADTAYDGSGNLYVSLRDNKKTSGGNPRQSLLHRLSYEGGTWSVAPGSPSVITTVAVETLTIAVDGNRRVWTTFETGGNIRVGYTDAGGTAFTFKTIASGVNSDDISSVTAFGSSIGVLWSNQQSRQFLFADRPDSAPNADARAGFGVPESAYGNGVGGCAAGKRCADNHINMKVVGNEVFAVVKTSLNDGTRVATDPLIAVLHRSTGGSWDATTVTRVSNGNVTKPALLLAPRLDAMYVFAHKGSVLVYQSTFANPSFGAGRVWTAKPTYYPTTTRQEITGASGAVVETTRGVNATYWHNELLPVSP